MGREAVKWRRIAWAALVVAVFLLLVWLHRIFVVGLLDVAKKDFIGLWTGGPRLRDAFSFLVPLATLVVYWISSRAIAQLGGEPSSGSK